jgi:hypothetical protein
MNPWEGLKPDPRAFEEIGRRIAERREKLVLGEGLPPTGPAPLGAAPPAGGGPSPIDPDAPDPVTAGKVELLDRLLDVAARTHGAEVWRALFAEVRQNLLAGGRPYALYEMPQLSPREQGELHDLSGRSHLPGGDYRKELGDEPALREAVGPPPPELR